MEYRAISVQLDEDAPDRWIFLDYQPNGDVRLLSRARYEVLFRPAPDDQGD